MRSIIVAIISLVLIASAAIRGDSLLDRPLTMPVNVMTPVQDRDIGGLTLAVAHSARIPLGFEELQNTRELDRSAGRQRHPIEAATVGEALAAVTTLDPRYDVHEMNGVIVVRPKAAWADPRNPLNQPVTNVTLQDVSLFGALNRVCQLLYGAEVGTPSYDPYASSNTLSAKVEQGGVLDVLNAIVAASDGANWRVMYRAPQEPTPRSKFWISIDRYEGVPLGHARPFTTVPLSMRPSADR